MKTLKIISAFIVAMIFTNMTMAQVDTDTTTVDTMSTASLINKSFESGLGEEISSPIQDRNIENVAGFRIGARYQPTFSRFNFGTAGNEEVRVSGEVAHGWGISLNHYFTNFFGVHLELMNTRTEYNFRDGQREQRVNINYLTVPLLASYNTNLGRTVNWNLTAGPYLGINTGASVTTTGEDTGDGTTAGSATGVIHVRPTDIGVAYGTGLDFGFGQSKWMHLRVGYRGTAGLVELSDNTAQVTEDQFNLVVSRSRMITNGVYLGLMFKL
jgi:hypothetical protein